MARSKITSSQIDYDSIPKGKLRKTTTQSVTNTTGTDTQISFNTTDFLVDMSVLDNGLVVEEDGIYSISAHVETTDAENFFAYLRVNTNWIQRLSFVGRTSTARGYQASDTHTELALNAGDNINLWYENRSFATTITSANLSAVRT